jgi:inhibitor of KinA
MTIFPLGDSAVTIELENRMGEDLNRQVLAMAAWLESHPIAGVMDLIVGYCSLSVYFDPVAVRLQQAFSCSIFDFFQARLEEAWRCSANQSPELERDILEVPVCYEAPCAPDLETVCRRLGLSAEEIISRHVSRIYRVYMIGFLPGFSYMGRIDDELVMPRKQNPVSVAAGCVGIAGLQTGIYSLACPGGWHIIGKTPWKIFSPLKPIPVRFVAGDRVRFFSVSGEVYRELEARESTTWEMESSNDYLKPN